jgi:PAS domain S-box-containing protein
MQTTINPENIYSEFIEQVKDYAIFAMDKAGCIVSWNKGAERILGYTEHEITGQHYHVLFPQEAIQRGKPEKELLLATQDGRYENEEWQRRKDATLFWAHITLTPIYTTDKELIGFTKITRDLTQQQAQAEALYQKNEELQKVNAELDSFVSRTSHDLRAPLMSVLGLVNLAQTENDMAQKNMYLDLIAQSVTKVDTFIKDMISYSYNTRSELVWERIPLKKLVEDTFQQLNASAKQPIDFKVEINEECPFYSDLTRLEMIITSLLSNAIRYTHPHHEAHIKVSARVERKRATIVFQDNGIGIGAEHIDKIFNIFYRATESQSGSGLGLYIVNDCLQRLQGAIQVESTLGKGSMFIVTIPNVQVK